MRADTKSRRVNASADVNKQNKQLTFNSEEVNYDEG